MKWFGIERPITPLVFVSVADKGLNLPAGRPIFSRLGLSLCIRSEALGWRGVVPLSLWQSEPERARRRGLGCQRGLLVAGVDFGAAVDVEAGRGAVGLMPDQRVWWKRASIWAGVVELPWWSHQLRREKREPALA